MQRYYPRQSFYPFMFSSRIIVIGFTFTGTNPSRPMLM
jgi:hypothetical protein